MSYGMKFGQDINNPSYTTELKRLQINLNNPAKLFDVVEMDAGTNMQVPWGFRKEETLFSLRHGLGYVPQVYVTFFVWEKAKSPDNGGYYATNYALFAQGGAGYDIDEFSADTEHFTIKHTVDMTGDNSIGHYTSDAAKYKIRVKYLICNNPKIQTVEYE